MANLSVNRRKELIETALFGQPLMGTEVVVIDDWSANIPHICPTEPVVNILSEFPVKYRVPVSRGAGTANGGTVDSEIVTETIAQCSRCGKLFLQLV